MSRPQLKKVIHVPRYRLLGRGTPSAIHITRMKSIKLPDPKTTKQKEEERLRAQLHKEIELRARTCSHQAYECTLPVLCGKEYCARHILEDPTAPYKQCVHTYGNGDRCPLPAPAPPPHDNRRDQGLCFEHARSALLSRQRSTAPPPLVTTTETLLTQLQHYVRPERTRTTSCASSVSVVSDPADQDQPGVPHAVDPFKQIDAIAVNGAVSTAMMECASASNSDADSVTLGEGGNCRGGYDEDESDTDETEYDRHPLRFAGIFTAEEAVSEAKTALTMLQKAYINQMGRLKFLLEDARLQYIKALRTEKEQYCSINAQSRSGPLTVRERRQLRKLKAYAGYHRRQGMDALLARKLQRKRAKLKECHPPRSMGLGRCVFSEGGVRCEEHVLPAARHCLRHVMEDQQQVLFVYCGDPRGAVSCREPVPRLPVPSLTCRYHTDPPAYTVFTLKKEDTDTDTDTQSSEFSQTEETTVNHYRGDKSDVAGDGHLHSHYQ